MMIIGCDFHPSWQQIAWLDTETGETGERKLVQPTGTRSGFSDHPDFNAEHKLLEAFVGAALGDTGFIGRARAVACQLDPPPTL
jgi:hypothetical protein